MPLILNGSGSISGSASTSTIVIDVGGRVFHPNQPAFFAQGLPADRISNATTEASPIQWRDCRLNTGNCWNGTVGTSTNNGTRFTASVAGVYYMAMENMYKHSGGGDINMNIYKNGSTVSYNNCHFKDNGGYYPPWTMSQINWVGQLAAGDYIEFYFKCSADGSSYLYAGGLYNKCFGWLIG